MANMAVFMPGQRYLLLLAAPASPGGLTTTVGLNQGAFLIAEREGRTLALNGRGNVGLLDGLSTWGQSLAQAAVVPDADAGEGVVDLVRALAVESRP